MQLGFRELAVSMVLAMVVAVGLFIALPLFVAKLFGEHARQPLPLQPDGGDRPPGYLRGATSWSSPGCPTCAGSSSTTAPSTRPSTRTRPGTRSIPSTSSRYPTLHPRCGTAFLLVVMVMAVLVFAVVGKPSLRLPDPLAAGGYPHRGRA